MTSLKLAVDGASRGNPGVAGIGVVLYNEDGEVVREIGEYIGQTTNNIAEYKALIRGLEEALRLGAECIRVQTDSELLARQVSGIYKVRAAHLVPLYYQVRELFARFAEARIVHVRREFNAHADRLASDAARRRADVLPPGISPRAAKSAKTVGKPAQKQSRRPQRPIAGRSSAPKPNTLRKKSSPENRPKPDVNGQFGLSLDD
jgi:ribonuclease HI